MRVSCVYSSFEVPVGSESWVECWGIPVDDVEDVRGGAGFLEGVDAVCGVYDVVPFLLVCGVVGGDDDCGGLVGEHGDVFFAVRAPCFIESAANPVGRCFA